MTEPTQLLGFRIQVNAALDDSVFLLPSDRETSSLKSPEQFAVITGIGNTERAPVGERLLSNRTRRSAYSALANSPSSASPRRFFDRYAPFSASDWRLAFSRIERSKS